MWTSKKETGSPIFPFKLFLLALNAYFHLVVYRNKLDRNCISSFHFGRILSLPPPSSSLHIRAQVSFKAELRNSPHQPTSSFAISFFLSLTLHSCRFRPLFPCPPSLPSLSFIQFNFELCTCRQAKRVAPWLPGTRPSHYTANWFWSAAMSAAHLPHPPHHLCTPDCLQQRRFQSTQDGDKQLHLSTSN